MPRKKSPPQATSPDPMVGRVREHLKELKPPTIRGHFETQARRAAKENLGCPQYPAE